jgi:capsular polysaccharide biosynthesis protein/GGDEF domain-containing protein
MELRRYGAIVRRWWVFALLALVSTIGATVWFVQRQPVIYESSATYVVKAGEFDALDTLIRGAQISATYASIARSEYIRQEARDALPGYEGVDISVSAEPVTGTNLIDISVRSEDPEAAQVFAEKISERTVAYVADLEEAYALEPLDSPSLPVQPVAPNEPLTIALGVIFGLVLAFGAALFLEYLRPRPSAYEQGGSERARVAPAGNMSRSPRPPQGPIGLLSMRDAGTGLYNEWYFRLRLRQEVQRALREDTVFSVGILRASWLDEDDAVQEPSGEDLRPFGEAIEPALREQDVLASFGEGTFAVLLPDIDAAGMELVLLQWEASIAEVQPVGRGEGTARVWVDVSHCEFEDGGFVGDVGARRIAQRLAGTPPEFVVASNGEVSGDRAKA